MNVLGGGAADHVQEPLCLSSLGRQRLTRPGASEKAAQNRPERRGPGQRLTSGLSPITDFINWAQFTHFEYLCNTRFCLRTKFHVKVFVFLFTKKFRCRTISFS